MKNNPLTRPADTLSPPGGEGDGVRGANNIYALAFGLFLGLAFWKFGNPVILDHKIIPPSTPSGFWNEAWPAHWAKWILVPLAFIGALVAFKQNFRWGERPREPARGDTRPIKISNWLWLLPLLWFGWQLISATQTVGADLTAATLWQFFGCVACYFLGALVLGRESTMRWLLVGVLAVFTFCLVRAADQRLVEFPQNYQMLVEDERDGWTNVSPAMLLELKRENVVITTNGVDVANPVFLKKFASGRVMGTLVYPNALAGAVLLLWPLALSMAFGAKRLRPAIRSIVIALACSLGAAGLFWTGSKLGWLIAMALGGLYLFRLNWPVKLKIATVAAIMVLGLGIFAVRFHNYFAAGATSASARLDYWRAAVQTTVKNPLAGTGPGTFQRPYALIKPPDAEMARLTHNDYLEQFSDSGVPGGVFYGIWIVSAAVAIGRRVWKTGSQIQFAVFIGLLGWFIQGIGEFSLYIPALAWTAFTLLGCSLAMAGNQFDKKPAAG